MKVSGEEATEDMNQHEKTVGGHQVGTVAGYANAQNQQNQQGQEGALGQDRDRTVSREEAFDEAQGGGRGADTVSDDPSADDIELDQQAHQDRGQSIADDPAKQD